MCYLFSFPSEGFGDIITASSYGKLFPGDSQYVHFMTCFCNIIQEHPDEFRKVWMDTGDLGSHSVWKGSYSYAAAGITVAPHIVSICLWAIQSMGGVKEHYLSFEVNDQFLGQVVTGMDCNKVSFTTSPPISILQNVGTLTKRDQCLIRLCQILW